MRIINVFKIIVGLSLIHSAVNTEAATRVSITQFKDKSSVSGSSCHWDYNSFWWSSIGSAFQEMLTKKLMEYPQLEVYERETIRQINDDEHELVNADETDKANPAKKKFKKAQITLVGVVSELEFCADGGRAGVDVGQLVGFGSLRVGYKTSRSKVIVDLRVIDVETGRVLGSVRGANSVTDKKFDFDGFTGEGVDFNLDAFSNSPIGQAARRAIEEAAERAVKLIPNKGV